MVVLQNKVWNSSVSHAENFYMLDGLLDILFKEEDFLVFSGLVETLVFFGLEEDLYLFLLSLFSKLFLLKFTVAEFNKADAFTASRSKWWPFACLSFNVAEYIKQI